MVRFLAAMGLWIEDCALDRLDKALSKPVFNLKFPGILELLLSLPGAFMGFPHAWMGPTPLVLAWIAAGCHLDELLVTAVVLLSVAAFGFYGFLHDKVRFLAILQAVVFCMPWVTFLVLARPGVSSLAATTGCLSFTASSLTDALFVPMKAACHRKRPCAALGYHEHMHSMRCAHVPYIKSMCTRGQALDSLPSSDSGVMAANAVLLAGLLRHGCVLAPVGFLIACGFGRMYFWAHHLLDVSCGALVGAAVAWMLKSSNYGASFGGAMVCWVVLVVALLAMQKRTKSMSERHG